MTACPQNPLGLFQVFLPDKDIIGVVGGYGEDAYACPCEGFSKGSQNTGEIEVQRPLHFQAAPARFGLPTGRDTLFWQDDGELLSGAGNRPEPGLGRALWYGCIRREAADGQPIRQDGESFSHELTRICTKLNSARGRQEY